MVVDIADGPDATRQTIEVTGEIHKAHLTVLHQLISVQSTVVITQTSTQCPAVAKVFRGSGIEAEVKEAAVRYQVFLAFVI